MKKQYEDTDFDASLKKADSDLMWDKKQKQKLKNSIIDDIEKLEFKESNNTFLSTRVKRVSMMRKFAYSSVALVILFSLFIGSAFISPAIAEVASKIPYLNKIFQSEPVNRIIWRELEEKGYKINGVGGNASHISISINGSEEYYQDVRKEVKDIAKNVLKSKEYDAYTVKVERQIDGVLSEVSDRDKAIQKSMEEIYEELNQLKVNVLSSGVSYQAPNSKKAIIHFEVPNTEKRIEEIKEITNEKLKARNIDSYSIKINKVDLVQREREINWSRIFPIIHEGLTAKKEYKVTGLAYSFHPAPLQIIIKTSIKSSDKDASEQVQKIEKAIQEFLNSKEIKSKIEGEPYGIIIRSKDKQKLN